MIKETKMKDQLDNLFIRMSSSNEEINENLSKSYFDENFYLFNRPCNPEVTKTISKALETEERHDTK